MANCRVSSLDGARNFVQIEVFRLLRTQVTINILNSLADHLGKAEEFLEDSQFSDDIDTPDRDANRC